MKALEAADELYRMAEEHGNLDLALRDQLEDAWRNAVTRIERDGDNDVFLMVSDA